MTVYLYFFSTKNPFVIIGMWAFPSSVCDTKNERKKYEWDIKIYILSSGLSNDP